MATTTHESSLDVIHPIGDTAQADASVPGAAAYLAAGQHGGVATEQRVAVPAPEQLQAMLGEVRDPVERARWATRLLKEFEQARLAVAEVRRVAAGQTGLGPRGLERALGISVTAAADLLRATHGEARRSER